MKNYGMDQRCPRACLSDKTSCLTALCSRWRSRQEQQVTHQGNNSPTLQRLKVDFHNLHVNNCSWLNIDIISDIIPQNCTINIFPLGQFALFLLILNKLWNYFFPLKLNKNILLLFLWTLMQDYPEKLLFLALTDHLENTDVYWRTSSWAEQLGQGGTCMHWIHIPRVKNFPHVDKSLLCQCIKHLWSFSASFSTSCLFLRGN